MFRIVCQISVVGEKESINRCAAVANFPQGVVAQLGLKRKVPVVNSWRYSSPRYRFHPDKIDNEVRDFIAAHARLGEALALRDEGITEALFTLSPVGQNHEEELACIFSNETLLALSHLGVGFEIAPASVLPEVPYWCQGHNSE